MLDWNFIGKTIIACSSGIPETLQLVMVPLLFSIPLAFLMAIVNLKPERLFSKIIQIYFSFVRSIPMIVIIFLLYHFLPLWIKQICISLNIPFNVYDINDMSYGYIVFTFVSIPSLSEVFRSGLVAVPKSQMEASLTIGMTPFHAYTKIVIPQAIDATLPIICNFVTSLVKMTSLAFSMSIREITGEARVAAADSIRYIECYIVIFFMYLIINILIEQLFKYLERDRKKYLIKT